MWGIVAVEKLAWSLAGAGGRVQKDRKDSGNLELSCLETCLLRGEWRKRKYQAFHE